MRPNLPSKTCASEPVSETCGRYARWDETIAQRKASVDRSCPETRERMVCRHGKGVALSSQKNTGAGTDAVDVRKRNPAAVPLVGQGAID